MILLLVLLRRIQQKLELAAVDPPSLSEKRISD
jgi:hypothetical protein